MVSNSPVCRSPHLVEVSESVCKIFTFLLLCTEAEHDRVRLPDKNYVRDLHDQRTTQQSQILAQFMGNFLNAATPQFTACHECHEICVLLGFLSILPILREILGALLRGTS
jgi:hypothetical protein